MLEVPSTPPFAPTPTPGPCHEDFDPNFDRNSHLSLGLIPFPWLLVISKYLS